MSTHGTWLRLALVASGGSLTLLGPVRSVQAAVVQQSPDSIVEHTVSASSNELVRLELETGAELVIRGWDQPRVRVRAALGGRDWRSTRVSVERTDNAIRVASDFQNRARNTRTSHRIELWVPARTSIQLSSGGGGVTIENVSGEFRGHTGGGGIRIHRASGSASLTTGGGDIRVSDSELSGTITTGGGAVLLSGVTGGLRTSSGSGPVITAGNTPGEAGKLDSVDLSAGRIRVPASADPLRISSAGGAIDLDNAPQGGKLRTGGGAITVRASGGPIEATTGGGSIRLHRVRGNATATTGAGDVFISVADGAEASDVRVTSGTGSVTIELPPNLDARFEIETAYTERHGRTRIESDWPLQVTETDRWDSQHGTPRRFVRGAGSAGAGRGLIHVRTVNGDVTIRRREP